MVSGLCRQRLLPGRRRHNSSCNRGTAGRGLPSHHTQTANFIMYPNLSAAHSIKFVPGARSGIYTLGGGAGARRG